MRKSKPKIIIIGGGIGGLSCATALAETGKFDISIFESDIIGGQASSKKSKLCNTEISWRVFGCSYNNLLGIIHDISAMDNFYNASPGDLCYADKTIYALTIDHLLANHIQRDTLIKSIPLILNCKERNIDGSHDQTADEYFGHDKIMRFIVGPLMGLEPTKVTLSAVLKFGYALSQKKNNYCSEDSLSILSKYPTSDSLFAPWAEYLRDKGVKIHEHSSLDDIIYSNGSIDSVIINNTKHVADEIVFACSLEPLANIFNSSAALRSTALNQKLNRLKSGQQFYISVNFYWKKEIIKDRECHAYTFVDGWMPIILKRFIKTDYVEDNCNQDIKEVWNIGVADYLQGNYVKKHTSQSSLEEIVHEIKMNIMNSPHFRNYFDFENNTWDDYFYGYEFDDRYYRKLPTTEKFSINKGIEENLLNNKEPELGDNAYFSAYYVKNTTGGASMETSCEIGLETADLICKKYGVTNPRKPIHQTSPYLYSLALPLVMLDCILYKLNLRPITDFINPILLLVLCLLVMVCVVYLLGSTLYGERKRIVKLIS